MDLLSERRHHSDIHCVEVLKDQHCLVFSKNRGIEGVSPEWSWQGFAYGGSPAEVRSSSRCLSWHGTQSPQLRKERHAREGEIPLSNATASLSPYQTCRSPVSQPRWSELGPSLCFTAGNQHVRAIHPLFLLHSLDRRKLHHQPFRWSLELGDGVQCDVGKVLVLPGRGEVRGAVHDEDSVWCTNLRHRRLQCG